MKILSLDGGGVKGALQARLLERLESRSPFLDRVDLFAGTSIGGIQALALAAGKRPSELVKLFRDRAGSIFDTRDLTDRLSGGLDEYLRANYSQAGLKAALVEVFEDRRLPQLKREVMLTTFDLSTFKPVFLDRRDDWSLVDAALATSAAPTYLPVHLVRNKLALACVDGGVFANNPSERALTFAKKRRARTVTLLSLGAGRPAYSPPGEVLTGVQNVLDWGIRQWIVKKPQLLIRLWLDGSESVADYVCREELGDTYCRVQPMLPEDVGLDDAGKVPWLIRLADTIDLEEAETWVKIHWSREATPKGSPA